MDASTAYYCASASQMFGVPVEKHGQNSPLRQKGKIAELALGYGGSVGALKSMGALEMGLSLLLHCFFFFTIVDSFPSLQVCL